MNYTYLLISFLSITIGLYGMYKNQFWKYSFEDSLTITKIQLFGSFIALLIIGLFCLLKI